jgi:hypothetical protein
MSDLYLWDRSGPSDVEVERLERLLGRYRLETLPPLRVTPAPPIRVWMWAAAACLAIAVSVLGYRIYRQHRASTCEIASVRGAVRVNNAAVHQSASLKAGDRIEVGGDGEARIRVGTIGEIVVGPESLLSLTQFDRRRRFMLERGSIEAGIIAAPYVFVIDTPFATAYDLGCAYKLEIAPEGDGRIEVTSGWVVLQNSETESLVGAGTIAEIRRGQAPGIPVRSAAFAAFSTEVRTISFDDSPQARMQALMAILPNTTKEDVIMLVNLLWHVDPAGRGAVFDRLASFYPPPPGVTREQIVAGNWNLIRQWWTGLGFGQQRKLPRRFYVD